MATIFDFTIRNNSGKIRRYLNDRREGSESDILGATQSSAGFAITDVNL